MPLRISPMVRTLKYVNSSGVETIQAATVRDGRRFISSETTFVSSKKPEAEATT